MPEFALKTALPARLPSRRLGAAADVAEVVAFMASPAARYVTGTTIDVDGGMSAAAPI